ncbi:hypothetical protein PM3016_1490 [Paenibacillus mucilaginosus 3016]|uniref:Uncharacterized protein n=1 Tax=Paenibacillus mucilaginosus 3016 TaxID=1116391 RepID=H6NGX3_9BACL|nr:hypothetical protein [Paenibacillus mucilaginosus]AFC28415.1 hypothetical protein PM3016_1490 [Paenibacillus mucilaginosus 3016]WFA17211.1 hypothetical protein ERY13_07815 [Paenibacillus mucilaginosus]
MRKVERNALQPGRLINVYYDLGGGEEMSVGHFREISIDILDEDSSAFIILEGINEGIMGINLECV